MKYRRAYPIQGANSAVNYAAFRITGLKTGMVPHEQYVVTIM